jgi:hypothetical protein
MNNRTAKELRSLKLFAFEVMKHTVVTHQVQEGPEAGKTKWVCMLCGRNADIEKVIVHEPMCPYSIAFGRKAPVKELRKRYDDKA